MNKVVLKQLILSMHNCLFCQYFSKVVVRCSKTFLESHLHNLIQVALAGGGDLYLHHRGWSFFLKINHPFHCWEFLVDISVFIAEGICSRKRLLRYHLVVM